MIEFLNLEGKTMKNLLKKITLGALAVMLCIGMTACGSSSSDTYKIAMEPTFPPFDTTNDDGELDGFDVDLMEAIAKDQGFKLEWQNMGFDGLIPALKSGNIDIVASGMYASEERKKEVDYSDTYYDSGLVIAVKADNITINSEADLRSNMKLVAQIGTSSQELIEGWAKEGKIAEAKIYDKVNDAVQDLKNGTVDALINDKPVTLEYINKQPDTIKIVGETLNEEQYGIAVQKGNTELLDKINAGLKNLKENGEFDKLLEKWNLK